MSDIPSSQTLSRPTPPCAETLGLEIQDIDKQAGRVMAVFEGKAEFCNPHGTIQGGFLSAMLDEICALAAVAQLDGRGLIATLEASTRYLGPARPGPVKAVAEVLKMGQSTAFMEGRLYSQDDQLIAQMSTTAKVIPTP